MPGPVHVDTYFIKFSKRSTDCPRYVYYNSISLPSISVASLCSNSTWSNSTSPHICDGAVPAERSVIQRASRTVMRSDNGPGPGCRHGCRLASVSLSELFAGIRDMACSQGVHFNDGCRRSRAVLIAAGIAGCHGRTARRITVSVHFTNEQIVDGCMYYARSVTDARQRSSRAAQILEIAQSANERQLYNLYERVGSILSNLDTSGASTVV